MAGANLFLPNALPQKYAPISAIHTKPITANRDNASSSDGLNDTSANQNGSISIQPTAYACQPPPSRRRALLAALPGRALGLRLAGAHLDPAQALQAELPALPAHLEGRDLIAVEYEDPFSFAGTVAALGDAVVVLVPDSLRQAVLSHLQGAAGLAAPEGE